jgi:tungstate transport system substrate-binding protein
MMNITAVSNSEHKGSIKKISIFVLSAIIIGASIWGGIYYLTPKNKIIIQTTTSMDASGLLQLLKPAFEEQYGIEMNWVAVGTGQALTNAGTGNGDLVIAHSPKLESIFINHSDTSQPYSGKGICRVGFAYNYFIIVGPNSDPAGVLEPDSIENATQAFKKIYQAAEANSSVKFISRGDNSGTHNKELSVWSLAHLSPDNRSWYYVSGQGMGQTLTMCNETLAYTLTDYGTWLKMRKNLSGLINLTGFAPDLKNEYSVIAVDPDQFEKGAINYDGAMKFIRFLVTDGLRIIENYTIDGEQVFTVSLNLSACFCGSERCEVENGELEDYIESNKNPTN